MTINDIISNSEYEWQYRYDDFKDILTEENRIRFEALKAKGFDARLFTYSEWQILAWDSFKENDDESSYLGECEMTDKDNDCFNSAMEKLMDEFEKRIGEEWAGTEEEIIERIVAKKAAEKQIYRSFDEEEMNEYTEQIRDDLAFSMKKIKSLSKDGDWESIYLYCLLDDETKKRYEEFETFVVGNRTIRVENCRYIPVRDFLEVKAEKIETSDDGELTTFLTMDSNVNPNPAIPAEIKDPNSLRSIAIAYNKMVNNAMDFYDASTGDDYDLGSNLYWLLDGKTKERLRSFSHDRFTYTSHPWTAQCKYLPDGFLCATVGLKVDDEVAYPALISNANPNLSVEISDPHSLQSIGEAYESLMNDVIDYYGELKEMQFAHTYMKSLLGILKKKNPDADWEHFSPRRIIEEIKNI